MNQYKSMKPLRDDVLLRFKPTHAASNSLIYFKENPDQQSLQYFFVDAVGPEVKHVKVGDTVLCDWKRITPPFTANISGMDGKYGITSEKEIAAILDE